MVNQDTIKDFIGVLKSDKQTTSKNTNNTYHATVTRIDDEGVVWVSIAGSDTETPTEATSSEIKRGDAVTVEWRNNKLYIAGNYSDPSAGIARVVYVENTAENAQKTADDANANAGTALTQATAAKKIADDTEQHFWFTETGTDTGAHITEKTQEDFLADPTNGGGNLLARSNGIAVRDGLAELASFSATETIIGKIDEAHTVQTSTVLQFRDENDITKGELFSDAITGFKLVDVSRQQIIRSSAAGLELVNNRDEGLVINSGDITASGTITDGTGNVLSDKLDTSVIDAGNTGTISTGGGTYKDATVTFNKTFATAPLVICGFATGATAGAFGRCSCSATSITTTGCTIRFFNGDTTTRSPSVYWIAISL